MAQRHSGYTLTESETYVTPAWVYDVLSKLLSVGGLTRLIGWGAQERHHVSHRRDHRSGRRERACHLFLEVEMAQSEQPPAPTDVATKAQSIAGSVGCPGCHLAYFQGDGTTARLAGQNHDYLVKTMNDFRDKTRGNNPGISDLMKSISPDDIAVLGQYLAGLQIDAYLGQGQ
jgi:cytochrome c553